MESDCSSEHLVGFFLAEQNYWIKSVICIALKVCYRITVRFLLYEGLSFGFFCQRKEVKFNIQK